MSESPLQEKETNVDSKMVRNPVEWIVGQAAGGGQQSGKGAWTGRVSCCWRVCQNNTCAVRASTLIWKGLTTIANRTVKRKANVMREYVAVSAGGVRRRGSVWWTSDWSSEGLERLTRPCQSMLTGEEKNTSHTHTRREGEDREGGNMSGRDTRDREKKEHQHASEITYKTASTVWGGDAEAIVATCLKMTGRRAEMW